MIFNLFNLYSIFKNLKQCKLVIFFFFHATIFFFFTFCALRDAGHNIFVFILLTVFNEVLINNNPFRVWSTFILLVSVLFFLGTRQTNEK